MDVVFTILGTFGIVALILDVFIYTPRIDRARATLYKLKSAYQIPEEEIQEISLFRRKKKQKKEETDE